MDLVFKEGILNTERIEPLQLAGELLHDRCDMQLRSIWPSAERLTM